MQLITITGAGNHHLDLALLSTIYSTMAASNGTSTVVNATEGEFLEFFNGPVWQAVFWLISRLWLICCERKTLFHD
jgi:hypothetical protein